MVESVDTRDLKSLGQQWLCGFKSRFEYKGAPELNGSGAPFAFTARARDRKPEADRNGKPPPTQAQAKPVATHTQVATFGVLK